ncbi:hypothetical protein [Pseudonocardia abyssalis]|uniref:Uncharacterized protein n=1 Tax=Pseudonocardia abyssalis TaxID=2792008 RepID=A0ABS6UWX1_9PSEU|nr:hypothetical protein [Pseudonocardia abyssalis]MBW0136760.1 hypothetical protein [Pseudonocardia abyssalis]
MRPPVVVGVAPGVGTSTLAAALHGVDGGVIGGDPVDVLVCRVDSFALAAAVGAPVLAVVADRPPRLDRFGAVVAVPDIAAWHGLDAPEVAGLLAVAPPHRPARLVPYIDALLEIASAVVASGALGHPSRPVVMDGPRPTPVALPVAPPAAPPPVAGRATRLPAAPAVPVPARAVERPLWRGLQAVQREPVLLRAPTAPPVPVHRWTGTPPVPVSGRPLRLRAEGPSRDLDDDALESMRTG